MTAPATSAEDVDWLRKALRLYVDRGSPEDPVLGVCPVRDLHAITEQLGAPPGVMRAERELAALRARVAELEAAHLAIAEAIDMVDHCEGQGAIVPDPSHVALTCGAMWRESLEAGEREDRARREGAEAMRERAAQVLDGMAALDAERMAEDVRTGDERGAAFWRMRVGRYETAAKRIRALPLTDDAGEESDR